MPGSRPSRPSHADIMHEREGDADLLPFFVRSVTCSDSTHPGRALLCHEGARHGREGAGTPSRQPTMCPGRCEAVQAPPGLSSPRPEGRGVAAGSRASASSCTGKKGFPGRRSRWERPADGGTFARPSETARKRTVLSASQTGSSPQKDLPGGAALSKDASPSRVSKPPDAILPGVRRSPLPCPSCKHPQSPPPGALVLLPCRFWPIIAGCHILCLSSPGFSSPSWQSGTGAAICSLHALSARPLRSGASDAAPQAPCGALRVRSS